MRQWTDNEIKRFKELYALRTTDKRMKYAHIVNLMSEEFKRKFTIGMVTGAIYRIIKPKRAKAIKKDAVKSMPKRPTALPMTPSDEGLDMLMVTNKQCIWPLWKSSERPNFRVCGCTVTKGSVYCDVHSKVAYINFGKSDKDNRAHD